MTYDNVECFLEEFDFFISIPL